VLSPRQAGARHAQHRSTSGGRDFDATGRAGPAPILSCLTVTPAMFTLFERGPERRRLVASGLPRTEVVGLAGGPAGARLRTLRDLWHRRAGDAGTSTADRRWGLGLVVAALGATLDP